MKTTLNIPRLRNIFLCGYGVSLSGDWLGIAALGWLLREEMQLGGSAYGLVSAAFALSFLVASPVAGIVARKKPLLSVIFLANLLQCLGSYLICYGATSHSISFAAIILIRVVSGACSSFKEVGESEFLKRLVGESESKAIIGWTHNLYYLARAALGYLSAIILSYLGTAWLFGIDGTTFLVMTLILITLTIIGGDQLSIKLKSPFLNHSEESPTESTESSWSVIKKRFRAYGQAFSYIWTRSDLMMLTLIIFVLEGVGYSCWLLAPTVVRVSFNEDSGFWYGMFLSISGMGGVLGMRYYSWAVKRSSAAQRKIFSSLIFMNVLFIGLLACSGDALQFSLIYGLAIFSWAPFSSYVKTYFLHQQESAFANSALQCVVRGIAPLSRLFCVSIVVFATSDPQLQILLCAISAGLILSYLLLVQISWRQQLLSQMFSNGVFDRPEQVKPVDEILGK